MKSIISRQRKAFGTLLPLLLALAAPASWVFAAAEVYPSRPIRFVIPWPPGGSNDSVARILAPKLSERLGKPVILDNRGGAAGIIGTEAAAREAPGGYTLMIAAAHHTLFAPLHEKLSFDPIKSFTPIARVGSGPNALIVHPSLPANSVKELIALAKQKPGKLVFACNGVGSSLHLGVELFKWMAGIDLKIVQFKGGGPAMVDLLGGHSQGHLSSLIAAVPQIKSGKVRVLGTGGATRSSILPDVPTIAEGGLPGYTSINWWGILAPAGTPAPIVTRLSHELKAIIAMEDVKKRFLNDGIEAEYMGPAEFGAFLVEEQANWTGIVKKANIKLEE